MENEKEKSDTQSAVPAETNRAGSLCRFSFPGKICGKGRTAADIARQIRQEQELYPGIIVSGIDENTGTFLTMQFPDGGCDPAASVFFILPEETAPSGVLIVTAGKEDIPLALEAKYTLEGCGWQSQLLQTSGLADLKRLIREAERLCSATACIVIAGVDGSLPAAVANLTLCPVIALPAEAGPVETAISCSNACGITVSAPGDAFGAGCAVARMMHRK